MLLCHVQHHCKNQIFFSNFDPKIIKPNQLALNHYEYLRKKKNLFTPTFSQKNAFFALISVCGMLKNFMGDPRLMNATLLCLLKPSYPLYITLLDMMTSLISLKAWQYFVTNTILSV